VTRTTQWRSKRHLGIVSVWRYQIDYKTHPLLMCDLSVSSKVLQKPRVQRYQDTSTKSRSMRIASQISPLLCRGCRVISRSRYKKTQGQESIHRILTSRVRGHSMCNKIRDSTLCRAFTTEWTSLLPNPASSAFGADFRSVLVACNMAGGPRGQKPHLSETCSCRRVWYCPLVA
jgi:hypothetical protein